MPRCAVIVAGGSGTRMGTSVPKQFLPVGDRSILGHCLLRFVHSGLFDTIVLVMAADACHQWEKRAAIDRIPPSFYRLTQGGQTRSESVLNGLRLLKKIYPDTDAVVAVHDGVRPFVSTAFLRSCLEEAESFGNAVPCLQPSESFRYIASSAREDSRTIDRSRLRSIQTPQCFSLDRLLDAFSRIAAAPEQTFTDEASLMEKTGHPIHLCQGLEYNIKITRPFDLELAEFFLEKGY